MNITNKKVLITGANRGIGLALVNEALRRGAKRVYAGMRSAYQNADKRVTPLTLDVTNASQIQRGVGEVDTLDVLINNAGIAIYDDLSNSDVIGQAVPLAAAAGSAPPVQRYCEPAGCARRDSLDRHSERAGQLEKRQAHSVPGTC